MDKNFRAILKNKKIPASGRPPIIKDEKFATIWHQVVHIVSEVAIEFDQAWQQRSRVINSMLLVLLIFRLLFSKNKQSYNTTIAELWDNCKRLNIPLPQEDPIAASSFADAREKLDENIFKKLNDRVISLYQDETDDVYNWLGHRLFAIDGSKINLPRELLESGYKLPSNNAHYPQGLLSCLYQLKSKIPYTFELANDANERQSALTHLKALKRNDVVVYDRGYFSYAMLYYHALLGIHPIFRLAKNTYKEIEAFRSGNQTDSIVTIHPLGKAKEKIERTHPGLICIPLQLRLIKYKINEVTYCLGTTLLDKKYPSSIFPDVYHSRWSIEELYKISKDFIEVEDFHSKNERGVKQELFAHFTLITMNRIFSNEASQQGSDDISKLLGEKDHLNEKSPKNINFKNCLATFARRMEEIFLFPASCVNSVVSEMLRGIKRCYQTIRPNRKYPRRSRKPVGKWRAEGMASGMVTVGQSINTCTP
ncbi:MAG: IS4 family transposase [Pseudomonadota bacterium]